MTTPKSWFLSAATVGQSAAARFAEIPLEDFRDAAEALGCGTRLTYPQVVEVIASLDDEQEESEGEDDDSDSDDGEDDEDDEES